MTFYKTWADPLKSPVVSRTHYLTEAVIGEYSSYQAALCAHDLEGQVIALLAKRNTHNVRIFSAFKVSEKHSVLDFCLGLTSSGADLAIF